MAPAGVDLPNTGHHHLLIDAPELPAMDLPMPMSANIIHFGKGQTEAILTLPEGERTLQLVLGDMLHIPHDPALVSEQIAITAK